MKTGLALFSVLVALAVTSSARGQNYVYATGNPAFSTQIPIENGFINVNNGEIHMEIPLATHAQRGRVPLDEELVYDSRIWQQIGSTWHPTNVPNSMGGWRFTTNQTSQAPTYSSSYTQYGSCGQGQEQFPTQQFFWNFSWTDPQGTSHLFDTSLLQELPLDPCQETVQYESASGAALDGSGYTISVNFNGSGVDLTVSDINGNQMYPTVQDTNGNYYSSDSNGNLIDTLGRTPVKTTTSGNQIIYNVLGWNGAYQAYTVTTETVHYLTLFSGTNPSGSFTAIQSIQLPDGSSYSFTYDSGTTPGHYGELTSVTLPSGGVIQYSWLNYFDSFNNENQWISTRVKDGGTTQFQPQTMTICSGSSNCEEKVTVTDPAHNATVYSFTLDASTTANASSWNDEVGVYQGSSSGGTELEDVRTNYTYGTTTEPLYPFGSETFTTPLSQTVQATLSDVGLTAQTVTTLNSTGALPTCIQNWDYYTGSAPTSPTVQTSYTYFYGGLPSAIKFMDGTGTGSCNGNEISGTTYGYDEATATPIAGLPNHQNVTGFGNLTSSHQWTGVSSPTLDTTAAYDNAGTMRTKTDSNGQTAFGHDSTDTFVTSTTPPTPSSGVSLAWQANYDPSSGLLENTTDPNGQETIYANYDSLGRVLEIDYPDLGKTTWTYPTASPYTSVTVNTYETASTYGTTQTQVDGFGRPVRTAVANGQSSNPWYEFDTCYNNVGQIGFQSYQYQAASLTGAAVCSGSGDTFAYDALSRVKTITHADSTSISNTYTGRAVETTDESGISRITQTDALGRETALCEISSTTFEMVAPASCGLDITGTGFLTAYSYILAGSGLAGPKTVVTQGAQSRVFQTDPLGRPISVQEPESGTTTYSYAYNSSGLQITRTKPRANQPSSSVVTTTTSQYDTLGRITSTTYSDGATPTRSYAYDVSNSAGWSVTPAATNLKGRLVLATSGSGSSATGSLFSYDAMGRVALMWECAPSTCGTASQTGRNVGYTYDLTGNVTSEVDAAAGRITYTYSPAREITGISNQTYTLSGGSGSQSLISNVQNGPNGPTSYTFGNGLSAVKSYDALGRLSGGWICSGSSQASCTGGTQLYGFTRGIVGSQILGTCDTMVNQCVNFGYDSLGRLSSRSVTGGSGTDASFQYVYDRYGNRWSQNATAGSGPQPNFPFSSSNNQISVNANPCSLPYSSSEYCYDAAGNMTADGSHVYTYDAEGNVTQVGPSGSISSSVYDALNHEVHYQNSTGTNEYLFDATGKITSAWISPTFADEGHMFWDGAQFAFRSANGQTFFQNKDWLETDRLVTDPSGGTGATYDALPFGDGGAPTILEPYAGRDFERFGDMDFKAESETYHAQFRQFSPTQGRWFSPDPDSGSYDFTNPQSFNRYSYVLNEPLSAIDPQGLDGGCEGFCGPGGPGGGGPPIPCIPFFCGGGGGHAPSPIKRPTPNATPWDDKFGVPFPGLNAGIQFALGFPTAGCEFGACGGIAEAFTGGGGEYPCNISKECADDEQLAGDLSFVAHVVLQIGKNALAVAGAPIMMPFNCKNTHAMARTLDLLDKNKKTGAAINVGAAVVLFYVDPVWGLTYTVYSNVWGKFPDACWDWGIE